MKRKMKMIVIMLVFVFAFMPALSVKATETDVYVVASNVTSRTAHVDWSGLLTYCAQMGYSFSYFEVMLDTKTIYENTKDTSMDLSNLNVGMIYNVWVTTHCSDSTGDDVTFDSVCSFKTLGSGIENVTDANTNTDNPADPFPAQNQTGSLTTPKVDQLLVFSNEIYVKISNAAGAQGYEIAVYNKNGNLIKTDESNTYGHTVYGIPQKTVIYVQIRTYGYDSDYNKVYSKWTAKKWAVVQPIINHKTMKVKTKSIQASWGKIKGANKYVLYGRKRNAKKWVKIATTKKTSYTIKKIKNSKINKKKYNYEFAVVAYAKVGKKTLKSGKFDYVYTY